jgi:hypothetical protein
MIHRKFIPCILYLLTLSAVFPLWSADFEAEILLSDTFEDSFSQFNEGIGGGWDVNAAGSSNAFLFEEAEGALLLSPNGSGGAWSEVHFAPDEQMDVFPLGEDGSSFGFSWVVSDLEVLSPRTDIDSGADLAVFLNVTSSDVSRVNEPQQLWHHDDCGVQTLLYAERPNDGETRVSIRMQAADETNVRNSTATGVVTHVSFPDFESSLIGETGGVWSGQRLLVRLTLTEQGGAGEYAYHLLVVTDMGEVVVDEIGTLNVGSEFENGAYQSFGVQRINDGHGQFSIEDVQVTREPVGGSALIAGRVWQDLNGNHVQDADETELPGISLDIVSGEERRTYQTDNDGYFKVSVQSGIYTLEFSEPFGYELVDKDVGADDGIDSDVDAGTGVSSSIIVSDGDFINVTVGLERTGFESVAPDGGTLAYDGFDYEGGLSLRDPFPNGGEGVLWDGPWNHRIIIGDFSDTIIHTSGFSNSNLPTAVGN